jgi:hypothetical protein
MVPLAYKSAIVGTCSGVMIDDLADMIVLDKAGLNALWIFSMSNSRRCQSKEPHVRAISSSMTHDR